MILLQGAFWVIKQMESCKTHQAVKLASLKSIEDAHDESVWAAAWVPAIESRPVLLLTGSLDEDHEALDA